jgi:pyruvate/2-oxoglutarate dehydrogenase complex dihydrolipoamide acyltransferase (E2) component
MKVRIQHTGPYSTFDGDKRGARRYNVGDVVDFPSAYARELVEMGLATEIPEIVTMTAPEVVWPKPDKELPAPEATTAAVELAAMNDIDLADVEGTGKAGRITKADVWRAVQSS